MNGAKVRLGVLAGAIGACCLASSSAADPPRETTGKAADWKRVSVAVARDRAKLMHEVYSATLDSMHHHFFRRDRAVLPARAMDDVFAEVDRKTSIKSRWIAVNTPAMSLDHEPGYEFEKKAAAELAAGKPEYEATDAGYYRRAAPVPLGAGCLGCHVKFGATDDKKPRFAGLVISVPVKDE